MTVSPLNLPEEQGSFDAFYRRFRPRVHVLVARHFPSCDPDDIAQETMTRCLLNFDALDPYRDPWPWVSSVARNAAIDSMRRTARIVSTDELPEPPGPASDTTYDAVLVSERRRSVRLALARLHPHDRQLIEDHELHGLPYADMAAVRDMTTNALRQRLFRARGRLAVELRRVGASLGVVPVALQARAARISRKLHDVAQVGGPAGATALSVAAVAGVTSVATFLGGPGAAPATVALPPRTAGTAEAAEATVRRVAAPAAAVRAATPPATRTVVVRPAAPGAQPPPTRPDVQIPFVENRHGDPTKPGEPDGHTVRIPTPIGDVEWEHEEEATPGYGLLCAAGLAPCDAAVTPTGG